MEDFFEEPESQTESIDFMRYFRGIVKRWWVVGIVAVSVLIPWIMNLKSQIPIFESEAKIGFESFSGGQPQSLIESRMIRLRSRTFAEEITAELGLTMRMVKDEIHTADRKDVFKTFFTNREPVSGLYALRFLSAGRGVLFHKDQPLDTISVEQAVNDTLFYNGFYFSLRPDVAQKFPEVVFDISDFTGRVESMIDRLQIFPNQSGSVLTVRMADPDPNVAAQTINNLADKFIQTSLDIRNKITRFQRLYIEEQLKLVREELNRSDAQLKSFRDTHRVDLGQETQEVVGQLNGLDSDSARIMLQRKMLTDLLSKVDPESPQFEIEAGSSIRYIYQKIAEQEVFDNDANMTLIRQELEMRNGSLDQMLKGGRPEQSSIVRDVSEKIQALEEKIFDAAKAKIRELDLDVRLKQRESALLQRKMANLPEEELRLIKLNRDRKANEQLNEMLLNRFKEAQIAESVTSESISVIDPALPSDHPITKSRRKQAMLGGLLGLFVGIGGALLWEIMDKSIRTRDDIKRFLKHPILGVIPKVKFDGYELQDSEKAKSISSQIVTHDYSPTPVGEAYRSLRTSLLFSKSIGPIRSLVIGSVAPGEGKSFTSANLAITMAQQKTKTLLIDADLRRGVLHNSFNCPKKPGLTNYLTGVVPLDSILNETYIPNLSLITCGSMIPNPSELLGSERMQKFIEGITQRFDIVIFDTPPLLAASDAVVLGTLVDGICMIVMSGKTKRNEVQRKMELFHHVQAKVVGIILNGAGVEVAHEGYSYYKY